MTIIPQAEELRRAIRWISERRCEVENPDMEKLVEEASVRFNLSPADEEFLARNLAECKD